MTIAEFLLAQYDIDEQKARAAYPGPWVVNVLEPSVLADGNTADVVATDQTRENWGIAVDDQGFGACTIANAVHIARHDPASVLADIESKRAIVRWHVAQCNCSPSTEDGDELPNASGGREAEEVPEYGFGDDCPTLRLLAKPFACRDGYNPHWGDLT